MEKHFVTFYSPGTFVPEETTEEIEGWNVKLASKMAHNVTERYGATPYGFMFTTRKRGDKDMDSQLGARSPFHWLGGRVETLEQIEKRNDPKEEILRLNMRGNGIKKVVVNDNSYRFTGPMRDDDVMLDWKPKKKRKAA